MGQVDTTMPLWVVILSLVSGIGTAIWSLISMYFKSIAMETRTNQLEKKFDAEVVRVNTQLEEHKEATSKNIDKIYKRIDDMRDLIIETNTYCKILLGDKLPHKK